MGKPNTRRLDREIQALTRKLEAVQERELWPLTGAERRQVLSAVVSGSYRVAKNKSTSRAETKAETAWNSAQIRLTAEITALQTERARLVTEAATAKAAKKSSGWW
ncbi:hypothetical protein [Streptomyces luteolus]|uniref:Mobilization protein n=1 Tax=Streptomyces luteolus TaxID=3043615 RepID=A0ABT6T6W2_9ACTN|nr:hypothetical protein [Streptomyces sp. B-S-A12]MDI3423632.1 hypothetical protein [Streptomyces sp. B-S-A12]